MTPPMTNVSLLNLLNLFVDPGYPYFNQNSCLLLYSRQSGRRVGTYLEKIIPEVVSYSKVEHDDELRETCIQVTIVFISY